jgi:hypothetical protein
MSAVRGVLEERTREAEGVYVLPPRRKVGVYLDAEHATQEHVKDESYQKRSPASRELYNSGTLRIYG